MNTGEPSAPRTDKKEDAGRTAIKTSQSTSFRNARIFACLGIAALSVAVLLSRYPFSFSIALGMAALSNIVYVSTFVILAAYWRIGVERVSFFYGSKWAAPTIGDVPVEVGWLPLGGFAVFRSKEDSGEQVRNHGTYFAEAPVWQRIVMHVSPSILFIILGMALLGFQSVHITGFCTGLLQGTLHPLKEGAPIVRSFLSQVENYQLVKSAGELALFFGLVNLLPIPPFSGGFVLLELARLLRRDRGNTDFMLPYSLVGWVVVMVGMAVWVVALVSVLYGAPA